MQAIPSIHPLGDTGLLISFGNTFREEVYQDVGWIYDRLRSAPNPLFTDIIPSYSSVAVIYDMEKAASLPGEGNIYSRVRDHIRSLLSVPHNRNAASQRILEIPVCYEERFAPDLKEMAGSKGLKTEEVIEIHTSKLYTVYMLGFLPGFPYMGIVDERIRFPRKNSPRTFVEAGSVAIAGQQTGIYPLNSPGGWQIIGRTPLSVFDPSSEQPAYFQPGDQVKFYSISAYEFENY